MVDPRGVANSLGLDMEAHPALFARWEDSHAGNARELAEPLTHRSYIEGQVRRLAMSPEPARAVLAAHDAFRQHEGMVALTGHLLWLAHHSPAEARPAFQQGPMIPHRASPEAAEMFWVFVVLGGLPIFWEHCERRGVSETVARDTLQDLEIWMTVHHGLTGKWGFSEQRWLILHLERKIYRLGRLQFEMNPYAPPWAPQAHVLRNRQTGRAAVLAPQGAKFNLQGYCDGVFECELGAWGATYAENETSFLGHVITPWGVAQPKFEVFSKSDWEMGLAPGDPCLWIHIPATGPMDHEECGESFDRALPFFREHFPEYVPKAFACHSWLLDPQFEEHLPPQSNLVRFLREWSLYPLPSANGYPKFLRPVGVPLSEGRTALHQALRRHEERGGRWRNGGGVILAEDLAWGRQVYRRQWGHYSAFSKSL